LADTGPKSGVSDPWRFLPAIGAAAATLWFARFVGPVAAGAAPEWVLPWAPSLGISLAFRLDGLSLAMALLICGIGALIFLYAATYFATDRRLPSLLITLSVFAISMLGLVTADDAITLFLFWEGTTITSWLLVGFDHERAAARAAATQALLITGAGGLALLAGLLLMGTVSGTFRLSEMNAAGDIFRDSGLYVAMLGLVVLGCFTKSAQVPFHFWLPGAMAAPTPVSAYLHSATMVKAGVYLLARMTPALGGTEIWTGLLVPVGAITMILGSVWAARQTDMKMMLAQTTLMGLSALVMLIGLGTEEAVLAAMTFLVIHAFYKAALFLTVGMIEKGAGSRDYRALGGLARVMPLTATAAMISGLSMAGFPPLFGFIGKELIYTASGLAGAAVTLAALIANAFMVICAGMVAIRPFYFGERASPKDSPGDPGWGLWLGPLVLSGLSLLLGLAPALGEPIIFAMTRAVTGETPHEHLALWHGVNAAFALSLLTFAIGIAGFLALDRIRDGLASAEPGLPRMESWYDGALSGLFTLARGLTNAVQNGLMTHYLRATFAGFAVLVWGAIVLGTMGWPAFTPGPGLVDWAVFAIILASIAVVLTTRSRLTAICALGGVGSGIAIVFVLYGAIDVAMTQLFVEILIVVFMAVAMVRLPSWGDIPFRPGSALIAILLGTGVTIGTLAVLATPLDPYLTTFFEQMSVPKALGHNIVNVILVDFRGFDTLGETSVIVIAGIAAIAALRAGRRKSRAGSARR
jgi:multicomponent Na+:H+ antiporter subunit A